MKKILLVEDDLRVRSALAARLRSAGYAVVTAPDPAFAILLAVTSRPDLLIADIWMPVMQGFTFVRRLESVGLAKIPTIFITASHQDGLWETAMSLGAAGFFEKPYDPERFLAAVARATGSVPPRQVGAELAHA